ncbi:cyclic nucleotide-binding domain-containing protein [Leisingera sp. F5]|uniref:cyclic nucleotide-binding domain-containing protein n=1 Tax=Leisingera sp. F5 TaxID=1813816 RepID=UPI000AFD6764
MLAILLEGSNSPQLYTVLKGVGTRYATLENGRRQVTNFLFPGDFAGLQTSLMGEMKHSVEAGTPMALCVFPALPCSSFSRSSRSAPTT